MSGNSLDSVATIGSFEGYSTIARPLNDLMVGHHTNPETRKKKYAKPKSKYGREIPQSHTADQPTAQ